MMNKAGYLLVIILLSWLPSVKSAELDSSRIQLLYNIDDTFITAIEDAEISTQHQQLWTAYFYFWKGIDTDDEGCITASCNLLNKISGQIEKTDELYIFTRLLQVRIGLMRGEYSSVLNCKKDIRQFIKEGQCKSDNEVLILALYNYFSEQARSEKLVYRLMLSTWPKGNKHDAIVQLKTLTQNESLFISTEAHYFLGRILLEYEDNKKTATKHFDHLEEEYPNNTIFEQFHAKCL